MKHLTQKLKSQRGASMLFALLVFLLCMLAGTAALTAAAANAGRYTHLEKEQRQYFSTSSALALLQAELDAAVTAEPTDPTDPDALPPLTVTAIYTETQDWQYDTATPGTTRPTYGEKKCTLSLKPEAADLNYYQKLLLQNCVPTEWRDDYTGGSSSFPTPGFPVLGLEYKYTIKPDSNFPAAGMPEDAADSLYPVEVTLKEADGSYTLQMDLTTGEDDAYPLHVVWSGEAETETKSETTITGNPADPSSSGTRVTKTTLTCTLRWPAENRAVTFTK